MYVYKHTDSPVKKKFPVHRSVKKVMLIVFYDMEGPITINLFEKRETENRAF